MRLKIAPSLLAADFLSLGSAVDSLGGAADYLHLDIMDGHFVPNLTFGWPVVQALAAVPGRPTLDAHLMVERPADYIESLAQAGVEMVTFHAESFRYPHRLAGEIRRLGMKAGLAFNPATGLECLDYLLGELDLVLIMSVDPGFGGQSFLPAVLPKIRTAADRIAASGRPIELAVDGGINTATAQLAVAAGATVLVAGSSVFGAADPRSAMKALREVQAPK